MRKFLWLNPVTMEMYGSPSLERQLAEKGFELVQCRQDHIAAVKGKYRSAVENASRCVADMRCPMAVDYIKEHYAPAFLDYPEIEPILLHCVRELQERLAGQGYLYAVTPCAALRDRGARLGLDGVRFYTWREFAWRKGILTLERTLGESPIPPGFFAEYGHEAAVLDSKEKIDAYFSSADQRPREKILELLYCPQGCHHGDGV